jgi:DnaJ-class molecular chaperone
MMTLYDELELTKGCTFDDIKHQYRILAQQHHPDKGGDVEKFKRIKFAYEVLSDPERRRVYDETASTDMPKDLRTEAITQLTHIFYKIMPNFDPDAGGNLIEAMKNEVSQMSLLIVLDQTTCKRFIKNLEGTRNKLKIKNPNEENLILSLIEDQLIGRLADLKVFEERLQVTEIMTNMLTNYEFGFIELAAPV